MLLWLIDVYGFVRSHRLFDCFNHEHMRDALFEGCRSAPAHVAPLNCPAQRRRRCAPPTPPD
jgi:hypothetical protein